MRNWTPKANQRFGKLTAIEKVTDGTGGRTKWMCQCDCGRKKTILAQSLRSGNSKTCGCSHGEHHGMKGTSAYRVWQNMRDRCRNEKNAAYKNYGGRGITVCERWLSFENFFADMGHRPLGKSLDRLDNDKGYSPENCAWRTRREQGLNTRVNHLVTIDGVTQPLQLWCEHYGVPRKRVSSRLKRGWDEFRALTAPLKKNGTC